MSVSVCAVLFIYVFICLSHGNSSCKSKNHCKDKTEFIVIVANDNEQVFMLSLATQRCSFGRNMCKCYAQLLATQLFVCVVSICQIFLVELFYTQIDRKSINRFQSLNCCKQKTECFGYSRSFPTSTLKACWEFYWDCVGPVDKFWEEGIS